MTNKHKPDTDNNSSNEEEEEDVPISNKFKNSRNSIVLMNDKISKKKDLQEINAKFKESMATATTEPTSQSLDSTVDSTVQFSTVREHTLRMTMGSHPDAHGVPVALSGDLLSELSFGVDQYEQGKTHQVKKITKNEREKIAHENHSRTSVIEVTDEMRQIRLFRDANQKEDLKKAELKEERKEKKKGSLLGFGLFRRKKQ